MTPTKAGRALGSVAPDVLPFLEHQVSNFLMDTNVHFDSMHSYVKGPGCADR